MNVYETEIKRLRQTVYSKQWQLDSVIATRNYIDNHYQTDLKLDVLSRARFTSKFHLLRLFKQYYGRTPKQYLIDKRIEKSKELLKTGLSISESCFSVGIQSPSSFCTLFKSKTNLTPTEFQKKQFLQSRIDQSSDTLAL